MPDRGELLLTLVRARAPRRLLLLAAGPDVGPDVRRGPELAGCAQQSSRRGGVAAPGDLAGLERADLAVLSVPAGRLLEPGLTQVLARLRDQLAAAVLVDTGQSTVEEPVRRHLRSLGFQPVEGLAGSFEFDLASCNPPRDWNTPDDWAHPENFHRYRW